MYKTMNMAAMAGLQEDISANEGIDFQKITISYSMHATFEIQ